MAGTRLDIRDRQAGVGEIYTCLRQRSCGRGQPIEFFLTARLASFLLKAFSAGMEAWMKSLARRVKGALALGFVTAIGISVEWSQALGQSTPDQVINVPEPSSLALIAVGVAGAFVVRRFGKRR